MKTEDFISLENEDLSDVEELMHSSLLNISDLSMQMESISDEEKGGENLEEEEDEEEDYNCAVSEILSNAVCSTPVKMKERLSVSLMDVSELESFPLGDGGHRSAETLQSSRSTVAKSKDSGYNHSGSSLSIGSSTDNLPVTNYNRVESKVKKYIEESKRLSSSTIQPSESEKKKCCTDLESFRRLREELEFKDVMISALQESNNSLRMKWADAQNKISELRMMSVQHCTCCPRKTKTKTDGGGWVERQDLMSETNECLDNSIDVPTATPPLETITSFMSSASRIQARRALATASSIGRMSSATQDSTEARQADERYFYHQLLDQNHQEEKVGDHNENPATNINLSASRLSPLLSATSSVQLQSFLPASRPNIFLPGDDPLDRVKVWQKYLQSPNCHEEEGQRLNQNSKKEIKDRSEVIGSGLGGRGDPEIEERTGEGMNLGNKNKTKRSWGAGGSSDWDGLHFRVFDAHISGWVPGRPQCSTNKQPCGGTLRQQAQEEHQPDPSPNPDPLRNPYLLQPIRPTSSPTTNTNSPSRRYLVENNNNALINSLHKNINLSTATAVISSAGNNYCWLKHGKRCLYDCLNEADRLAEELSTGLAKIPVDLENIRGQTHLTLRRSNIQHRVK